LDGDIFIEKIILPVYQEAIENGCKNFNEVMDYIMKNPTSRAINIETTSITYDYLREKKFSEKMPIGNAAVALIGTTKHANLENDNYNCFTVSELSVAVMPYYVSVKADEIISGTLAITPKTISEKYLIARNKSNDISDYLQDGSLEVALISYQKNESNGYVTPTNITNITKAFAETETGLAPLKISASKQPIDNIYKAKEYDDYTM
jgi:hypothetical protein